MLPPSLQTQLKSVEIHVPDRQMPERDKNMIDLTQAAVEARRVLELDYRDVEERLSRTQCAPARALVLGQGLDAGRLVRTA